MRYRYLLMALMSIMLAITACAPQPEANASQLSEQEDLEGRRLRQLNANVSRIPTDQIIMTGDRIGDMRLGRNVLELDLTNWGASEGPEATEYTSSQGLLRVCNENDHLLLATITKHPNNANFVTPDGVSLNTDLDSLQAVLGNPDDTKQFNSGTIQSFTEYYYYHRETPDKGIIYAYSDKDTNTMLSITVYGDETCGDEVTDTNT